MTISFGFGKGTQVLRLRYASLRMTAFFEVAKKKRVVRFAQDDKTAVVDDPSTFAVSHI